LNLSPAILPWAFKFATPKPYLYPICFVTLRKKALTVPPSTARVFFLVFRASGA
jgi:hypothetical protein